MARATRTTSRRRGGSRAERAERGGGGLSQLPRRRLSNPYRPIEVLGAEEIAAIHETSLRILEEIGMDFLHPEGLAILRQAGAEVTPGSERVRLDRGLVDLGAGFGIRQVAGGNGCLGTEVFGHVVGRG